MVTLCVSVQCFLLVNITKLFPFPERLHLKQHYKGLTFSIIVCTSPVIGVCSAVVHHSNNTVPTSGATDWALYDDGWFFTERDLGRLRVSCCRLIGAGSSVAADSGSWGAAPVALWMGHPRFRMRAVGAAVRPFRLLLASPLCSFVGLCPSVPHLQLACLTDERQLCQCKASYRQDWRLIPACHKLSLWLVFVRYGFLETPEPRFSSWSSLKETAVGYVWHVTTFNSADSCFQQRSASFVSFCLFQNKFRTPCVEFERVEEALPCFTFMGFSKVMVCSNGSINYCVVKKKKWCSILHFFQFLHWKMTHCCSNGLIAV